MSTVTTHVLDTARGRPAVGVSVRLERLGDGAPEPVAEEATDSDGRVRVGTDELAPGAYRLVFGTGDYFAGIGVDAFYPRVAVDFTVDPDQHYHVPLLVSPYAYSTYRGT